MKQIALVLLVLCTMGMAHGQRHHFISYSVNEGLAQSQVRDIAQSNDGYLWIATVGGLSRFDGIGFETYNKSNGLINNLTNSLKLTTNNKLIASCPGGLVTLDDGSWKAKLFREEFREVLINDMVEIDDKLYLASNGKGLLVFSNDSISKVVDLGSKQRNFIRCMSHVNGEIIVGTKRGLLAIDASYKIRVLNDSISVTCIAHENNDLWVGTNGDGIYRYSNDDVLQWTRETGLHNQNIKDVAIDHHGRPWFLNKNSIQRWNNELQSFEIIEAELPDRTSSLKVLYVDMEGNIWIGTDGSGVLKYTGEEFEIYNTSDGFTSDIIMDIEEDPMSKTKYFATYGAGVVIRHATGVLDTLDNADNLTNRTVWCLQKKGDSLWIGTSSGLFIYSNQVVRPFKGNDDLPFARISNLYVDEDENLWAATRNGIAMIQGDSTVIPDHLASISIRDAKSMLQINGSYYVTTNNGLVIFDDSSYERLSEETGFPQNQLTCVASDKDSVLWIGSEEGMVQFDPATSKSVHLNISEKVSSNVVNLLCVDHANMLWVGTDNGLFSFNIDRYNQTGEVYFKLYNEHEGVSKRECNQNACLVDREGDIWFGTNGGLFKRRSAFQQKQESLYSVNITDVLQDFQSILINGDLHKESDYVFDHQQNRLSFEYSAIHFSNPEKILYSYRLLGADTNWSPQTRQTTVTFSNLQPGSYTFEIRAKIEGHSWDKKTKNFSFTIEPPFWRTWWFISACLILFGAILFFIYKGIGRQREAKRQIRESEVNAKIISLEQQTLNAHMNRHFIFNALNSIQYFINTQDRKQANLYLTKFASLVRKNLDSAQTDSITLKEEIDRLKLYLNLEMLRFPGQFDFEILLGENVFPERLRVPSMLLQPFVENSIMHGLLPLERFGQIFIKLNIEGNQLKCVIEDTGIGISASMENKRGTSKHVSNGMKITRQRLELLENRDKQEYGVFGPEDVLDDEKKVVGTRVTIVLPVDLEGFS